MDPPQSLPPMSFQFRPAVPAQQSQQFIPAASHPFQPIGIGRGIPPVNMVLPPGAPQAQQPFYSQPMQQFPPRGGQSIPLPIPHPHPNAQTPNGFTPPIGLPAMPLSSSFTFAPLYGQSGFNSNTQYQSVPQSHAAYASSSGQPILSTENQSSASVTPQQQSAEQPSITNFIAPETSIQPNLTAETISDWIEHTSPDGRRYYYNRRTKLSSWEKPVELMTPTERADASTNWKEFTSPDGKKYYYNKVTKESKWVIPEELKLIREQVAKTSLTETQPRTFATYSTPTDSVSSPAVESVIHADTSSKVVGTESSVVTAEPIAGDIEHPDLVVSRSSSSPVVASPVEPSDGDHESASVISTADTATGVGTAVNVVTEPMNNSSCPIEDINNTSDGVSAKYKEEASNDVIKDKTEDVALEDKAVDREPLVYANKMEAKNAFMALLESANVGSDWTWDRAMRLIINDKRYGALKSLGERKQAFNEFLSQRKRQDVEERRLRQKKAREEFKKMLEESTELTSSTRWSKAESLFESDERFKAVERDRDRKDLFDNHIEELVKEERVKAQEERRHNVMEYRQYLKSCDFIKANSQWRKVQDRLETDERCSRLEKIDRLDIFQEYINDLEREEEEQRKIQKEELRKVERKNRDEFRKLMEDHVAAGILTAKTHWHDYCIKVKDLPAHLAVLSNTSGSTPKDLFNDVKEELQRQYQDDKTRIKDAVKLGKITLSSTLACADFKTLITNDVGSPPVSDVNLTLVFDELLVRAKDKEAKEAKKLKRHMDDFSKLLSFKEITASSEWENCKSMFSHIPTYSSIGEKLCQQIFEKYVTQLKEQAKEREQKRKEEKARKEKDREERDRSQAKQKKEKEAGRTKEKEEHSEKDGGDNVTTELSESHISRDNRRSGNDSNGKHRKRHHDFEDRTDENETKDSKKSHGSSSHKKSRRHIPVSESDHENRLRRHRRDHRHGSRRNGDHNELEDGEFGDAVKDN